MKKSKATWILLVFLITFVLLAENAYAHGGMPMLIFGVTILLVLALILAAIIFVLGFVLKLYFVKSTSNKGWLWAVFANILINIVSCVIWPLPIIYSIFLISELFRGYELVVIAFISLLLLFTVVVPMIVIVLLEMLLLRIVTKQKYSWRNFLNVLIYETIIATIVVGGVILKMGLM